jgi:hypothetical protein
LAGFLARRTACDVERVEDPWYGVAHLRPRLETSRREDAAREQRHSQAGPDGITRLHHKETTSRKKPTNRVQP